MDDQQRQSAFMSALTTEHFVLQSAASAAISEGAARASLYTFSLSAALVAMGFASQSPGAFAPFVATVLPALFLLGIFTVVRLVDIGEESRGFEVGIARIRGYYRTLTPEAAQLFAPEFGRWPEVGGLNPALRLGSLIGFLTTIASMVAFTNAIVAGAGITLLMRGILGRTRPALLIGIATAVILMALFYAYQRWRFRSSATEEIKDTMEENLKTWIRK